jgi:hypothetical protein
MPDRFPGRTVGENADAFPTKNISALGSPPGSVKLWVCGLASVLGDIGASHSEGTAWSIIKIIFISD